MRSTVSYARANDPDIGLDITIAAGTITRDDMLRHVREQLADPHWPIGGLSLSDFRLVDALEITPEDLQDAAALYAPKAQLIAQHKTAYLRTPVFRGASVLGREFEERYGLGPMSFDDLPAACYWLGIEVRAAEAIIDRLRAELASADD